MFHPFQFVDFNAKKFMSDLKTTSVDIEIMPFILHRDLGVLVLSTLELF